MPDRYHGDYLTIMPLPPDKGLNSQAIGDDGEAIANLLLQRLGLTPRVESKDRGEDLSIEVPDSGGRITRVYVQVKSSSGYSADATSHGPWRARFDPGAIRRYRNSSHLTILLAPDTATEEVRWSPLRPHVELAKLDAASAPSIPLGPDRVLARSDRDAFLTALQLHIDEVRAHQVNFPRLIGLHSDHLEGLDHRLKVSVRAVRDAMHIEVAARDHPVEVSLKLRLATDANPDALRDSVAFGLPCEVRVEQIEWRGSALLESFNSDQGGVFSVTPVGRTIEMSLGTLGPDGVFQKAFREPGESRLGQVGGVISFAPPDCPMHVEVRLPHENWLNASISANWNLGSWLGRPLRDLPYFERAYTFIRALLDGHFMAIAVVRHDEDLVAATFRCNDMDLLANLAKWMEIVSAAVRIDRVYGLGALVQDGPITQEDAEGVLNLDALVRGESVEETRLATMKLRANQGVDIPLNTPLPLYVSAEQEATLWGKPFARVPVLLRLVDYHIVREPGQEHDYVVLPGPAANVSVKLDTRSDPNAPFDLESLTESPRDGR